MMFAAITFLGCGNNPPANAVASNDTPTEAYKRLYAAVKSKNIDSIKNEMTKQSNAFVATIAQMQNKPVDQIYANGLTSTLHSETLPEIRDQRINGDMGAIEVYNSGSKRWEDLPFILEDGKWKLAIGDDWNRNFKSPGMGRDLKERQAANVLNSDPNKNSGVNTAAVANNGPSVNSEPPVKAK